jgi:phosphopantothenate-cysteine ligase
MLNSSVRFLDNFSAGTRGATSAEYFLSQNYAVIFLHRIHSLRPFSRHYSHSLNPFLDLLTISPSNEIIVRSPDSAKLRPVLEAYNRSQSEGTLLSVDFQTVNEYLWLLRSVSGVMGGLGRRGMFYLAAAVSDFFLPEDRTVSQQSSAWAKLIDVGRTQDSIWARNIESGNGSSSKSPQALGTRMDPRRLYRFF